MQPHTSRTCFCTDSSKMKILNCSNLLQWCCTEFFLAIDGFLCTFPFGWMYWLCWKLWTCFIVNPKQSKYQKVNVYSRNVSTRLLSAQWWSTTLLSTNIFWVVFLWWDVSYCIFTFLQRKAKCYPLCWHCLYMLIRIFWHLIAKFNTTYYTNKCLQAISSVGVHGHHKSQFRFFNNPQTIVLFVQ